MGRSHTPMRPPLEIRLNDCDIKLQYVYDRDKHDKDGSCFIKNIHAGIFWEGPWAKLPFNFQNGPFFLK